MPLGWGFLARPCSGCPFRVDGSGVGHLREGHIREIAAGESFPCHKTNGTDGTPDRQVRWCAGFLTLRQHSLPFAAELLTQAGILHPDQLDPVLIWPSVDAMVLHHTDPNNCPCPFHTSEAP